MDFRDIKNSDDLKIYIEETIFSILMDTRHSEDIDKWMTFNYVDELNGKKLFDKFLKGRMINILDKRFNSIEEMIISIMDQLCVGDEHNEGYDGPLLNDDDIFELKNYLESEVF